VGLSILGIAEQREFYKIWRKFDYVQRYHTAMLLIVNEYHISGGCLARGPREKLPARVCLPKQLSLWTESRATGKYVELKLLISDRKKRFVPAASMHWLVRIISLQFFSLVSVCWRNIGMTCIWEKLWSYSRKRSAPIVVASYSHFSLSFTLFFDCNALNIFLCSSSSKGTAMAVHDLARYEQSNKSQREIVL